MNRNDEAANLGPARPLSLCPPLLEKASQKAHVRFLQTVYAWMRVAIHPRRPTQRHCRPGCRADAARRREAVRRSAVIDRLDPCDPGRFE